jgi:hypothetical protein
MTFAFLPFPRGVVAMSNPPTGPNPAPYDPVMADYLRDAESRGQAPGKIPAIKTLREKTGLALRPAKDVVEDYGRRHGVPSLVPTEVKLGYQQLAVAAILVAIAALLGIATYYFTR